MKKLIVISAFALVLGACAHGVNPSLPKLPGPADNVDCTLERKDASMEGTYNCTIEGRYIMEEFGIF